MLVTLRPPLPKNDFCRCTTNSGVQCWRCEVKADYWKSISHADGERNPTESLQEWRCSVQEINCSGDAGEILLVLVSLLGFARWTLVALLLMKCLFCILRGRESHDQMVLFHQVATRQVSNCCGSKKKSESLCFLLSGFVTSKKKKREKTELRLSWGGLAAP